MFAVQVIAKKLLGDSEYSAFAALIQVTNWMTIPALGLQMVFTQQTASATTELQRHQLVGAVKAVLKWTFGLWLVMACVSGIYHAQLEDALKLSNPAALWLTVGVGLTMLWQPIFQGLLQGRQNFLWLGWVAIINGLGRVVIGFLIVTVLKGQAAGLMAGVLIGLVAALGAGAWQNLDLMKERAEAFDALGWFKRVAPLTLGFGVSTFIFSADAIVVQNFLGENGKSASYLFIGTLCRAIVLFTAPLAAVMFPKLVKNRATSQKGGNLLGLTLLVTGGLSAMAVAGLTLTSPILMKIFAKGDATGIASIIPWFAGGMVPLAMGNVVLNNLMAHSRFKVVPVLTLLAIGYWIALQQHHSGFLEVVKTFDVFSLAFLAICAFFNWVVQPDGK